MQSRSQSKPVSLLFYSHAAKEIARWCGISHRTALAYKRGERTPSPAVVRLFVLHRDRRVLTKEWPRGWVIKPDCIVDPAGQELPRSVVEGYYTMLQWARGLARERGRVAEYERRLEAMWRGAAR